jgi:hypothetical protein
VAQYFLSGMVVYGCTTTGDVTSCPLDFARMLSIAFSGGLCIFVFVYFSASFRCVTFRNLISELRVGKAHFGPAMYIVPLSNTRQNTRSLFISM